jgi:hypothetical protein
VLRGLWSFLHPGKAAKEGRHLQSAQGRSERRGISTARSQDARGRDRGFNHTAPPTWVWSRTKPGARGMAVDRRDPGDHAPGHGRPRSRGGRRVVVTLAEYPLIAGTGDLSPFCRASRCGAPACASRAGWGAPIKPPR